MRTVFSNDGVVPQAIRGRNARNSTGSFSTDAYRVNFPRYGAPYVGHLPRRLADILNERFRAGAIAQVIYSYSTPIAWLDAGAWIVPDVTYSTTTSVKHQTHLYQLRPSYIPADAGMDEYMQVLNGRARYTRGYGRKLGTYVGTGA